MGKEIKNFCNGKSLREISNETGIRIDTIRGRWQRGIRTYEGLTRDDNLHNSEYRYEIATAPGKRILEEMREMRISITKLSELSKVPRSTIWHFIYEGHDISSWRLLDICLVLGVSMDYILGRWRKKR